MFGAQGNLMQDRIGLLWAARSGDRDVPGFGKNLKQKK